LAVADHRAQALGQRVEAVGRVQPQRTGDLLRRLRALGGFEEAEDGFAAGDRLLVALRFALRMRIDEATTGAWR